MTAQETRTKNAEYKAALEARRSAIEAQIASLCTSIANDPQSTAEQRLRAAEIALDLYHHY